MSGSGKNEVVADLRTQGYHVFDKKLPDELCERLLEFALSHPCVMRPMDGEGREKAQRVVYPRGKPETVRYDFTTQDLLTNRDVQTLLGDMSFPTVAQDYLGARPVMDVVAMWWHTAYSDKPDMDAAQYYHFDMDRPKWLKFFIYLTDVTTDNGPHTFISGSQQTGGIPDTMLKKGYARLTDEEVEQHYDREKVVEFAAPRGTIIAEDTRGLHKGKHVAQGDRLILQIQFSNSLFGGYYSKSDLPGDLTGELGEAVRRYPYLYSSYL
ncbi:MAG: phytanoyl-CoA dioxygenase family protein [Gallionellaceae bacterium]